MVNSEKVLRVLLLGKLIDADKGTVKEINGRMKETKEEIRKVMLKDLNLKKINDDTIQVEVRTKSSFDIDIFEKKYPELFKKYTRTESRIVTITEKEFIFDKEKFMKLHQAEYKDCIKHGTPGVYITRLNT